jgi:hypothetical protein
LLADVSEVNELEFKSGPYPNGIDGRWFFDAESLAHLMEQCQSLKALKLEQIALDRDHIRVLRDISRPGLEIELAGCQITGAAAAVLAQVLACNQGPSKLDYCDIDFMVLADALRGNRRLKSLAAFISDHRAALGNQNLLAFAGALRENKGHVHLEILLWDFTMSNETWDAVCDSLKTHPTLQVLNTSIPVQSRRVVLKSRIRALVDMLKVNTLIHTIHLGSCHNEHDEIYRKSIMPYLETNRFRPRLLAIQKTRSITYRAKLLGRALLLARTDANRFWMLLSGNHPEVAFSSRTTKIAAAANLPTPDTAATDAAILLQMLLLSPLPRYLL